MKLVEINELEFVKSKDGFKVINEQPNYYYYKIVINEFEYFISTGYKLDSFIQEKLSSDFLFCVDNYILIFSKEGTPLLVLRIFEPIYIHRVKGDNVFLFSERLAYVFSLKTYCLNSVQWFSDILIDIEETNEGYRIKCFDESIYQIGS
ncbi:MAG: hypothetical protein WC716_14865 [Chitinophagaceae bacterium]|jgi:hypothetical protein